MEDKAARVRRIVWDGEGVYVDLTDRKPLPGLEILHRGQKGRIPLGGGLVFLGFTRVIGLRNRHGAALG